MHFMDALHSRLYSWLERDSDFQSGWQKLENGQVNITTDQGSERTENQDRVVVLKASSPGNVEHLLVIVCDGMGGMLDGGLCASLAVSGVVVAFLRSRFASLPERLSRSAQDANLAVFKNYAGKGGATLSAVCVSSSGEACGLNVGDSRIYGSRSGKIAALSIDDTIAGQIGPEKGGAESNSLLQFIGIGPDMEPHVVEVPADLNWVFITTDGAHFIPSEALALLVARSRTATEMGRRVVQAAQWMGSRDNGTVACVQMPLRISSSTVERSVRLVDPWGELHVLNPTEGRPIHATNADHAEDKEQQRHHLQDGETENTQVASATRDKRSNKRRVTKGKPPSSENLEKPTQSIEIFEINDTSTDGNK